MTVAIGDFNFVDPDEGRMALATSDRVFDNDPVAGAHARIFADCVGAVADGFNRRGFRGVALHPAARIDRCWLRLPALATARLRIQASYMESVADMGLPSGHAPLAVTIAARGQAQIAGDTEVGG